MRGACAPCIGLHHRRALADRRNAACRGAQVAIVHRVKAFSDLTEQGRARRLRPLALAALEAYSTCTSVDSISSTTAGTASSAWRRLTALSCCE